MARKRVCCICKEKRKQFSQITLQRSCELYQCCCNEQLVYKCGNMGKGWAGGLRESEGYFGILTHHIQQLNSELYREVYVGC